MNSQTMQGPDAFLPQTAQNVAESGRTDPRYPALADLAIHAPIILDGAIRSAARIKGEEAVGLAPGHERYYVTVDVSALIRGQGSIAPRVGYIVDVPLDSRGRAPRLKELRVLSFARPVPGRPDQLQLIGPDAQRPWSPELDRMTRDIVRESLSGSAPPEITGVGNAFHVKGTLPGEGETQIFLQTASGDPISLSILSRPGQDRRWAVALGEIVDDAAAPPPPNSLLWYRLACGLPDTLPPESVNDQTPENADAARSDYQFVKQTLGPCGASARY